MGVRPDPLLLATGSPAVTRFEAGSILAKLRLSGLLGQGCAHVIGVEAIREAFGVRWTARKEVVWDMAETLLLRRVGARAFAARLSETAFLVITPKTEPLASRALAARVSKDLFEHFLGQDVEAQISIKVVIDFTDETLSCRSLTLEELNEALAESDRLSASRIAPLEQNAGVSPFEETALTTVSGQRLRFSTSVSPIIDLRQWAVAGHRIEPKIIYAADRSIMPAAERRNLLPHDAASVDRATLAKGLRRLEDFETSRRQMTLILTISFLTVSSSWALSDLVSRIDPSLRNSMTNSVIWEIADFEAGVPAGRLLDSIYALRPYGRAVFARADGPTLHAISEQALGRCGLVFQPASLFTCEDEASEWLMGLSRVVAKRSSTLVAANLPSSELLVLARSVGFTHATMRPLAA